MLQSPKSNRKASRRLWLLLGGLVGVAALAALGFSIWETLGVMAQDSRFSDLANIRHILIRAAEREGAYPSDFRQFMRSLSWLGTRAPPEDFAYVAAGTPYDEVSNPLLFYELKPRRYAYWQGRYYWFQQGWEFRKENGSEGKTE